MRVVWGAATHVGMLRQSNEDAFAAQDDVFVVADGMGGHNAGEIASALAVKGMRDAAVAGFASAESVVAAINAANIVIHTASGGPTDQRGMGTTLTAVVPLAATADEPQRMVVANVGDSRVYLWRGGELKQVSADHSYVQELLSEGFINAAEARVHPRRNIVTRALGIEGDVSADSWTLPMIVGDRYVLCSDGLVDEVQDEQIAAILRQSTSAQHTAESLVTAANANGGRDNVTVVVVDVADETAPTVLADSPSADSLDGGRLTSRTSSRVRRVLVAVAVAGAIFSVGVAAAGWYARGGYFVGFDGSGDDATLVVFKGRPRRILWFSPTVRIDSGVTRAEVFPALAADIDDRPEYESLKRARAYVESIRGVVEAQRDEAGS
jgi:protein phosphatase